MLCVPTSLFAPDEPHPLGTIFIRKCSICSESVALALSGQRQMREHPTTIIVCSICASKDKKFREARLEPAPGAAEEALAFAKQNGWI